MTRLEEVLETNAEEETVRDLSRYHATDPLDVMLDIENKSEIGRNLETVIKELNATQQQILMLTAAGYSVRRIAAELNRSPSTILGCRETIGKRLLNVADEDRIVELRKQLGQMNGKKKKGRRYRKILEEYERRYAVREALKKLFVALSSSTVPRVENPKTTRPTCLFERMMSASPCRLPQYFKESFGDERTVCSLCPRWRGNQKSPE